MSLQTVVWALNPNCTTPYWSLATSSAFRYRRKVALPQAFTMRKMDAKPSASAPSKRVICPSCSKPPRTCLCGRFKSPPLDNSVNVTILQHSLERNHPLNSTRIAKLGLRNVTVASVTDVLTEAKFIISSIGDYELLEKDLETCMPTVCENVPLKLESDKVMFFDEDLNDDGVDGEMDSRVDSMDSLKYSASVSDETVETPIVNVSMGRYGSKCSCELQLLPRLSSHWQNFDQILDVPGVATAFANGFLVEKIGSVEAHTEFKLNVPCGSVLLFPSENAVDAKDLGSSGIKVKNLIVLDGTWAKATRMYNENPWLKALPHLKLELDKSSLYGEVRTQPKEKCLSTIESIVYALKAVGSSPEGLDGLLDVFESMVGDQRRCMHERLSNLSQV